MHAMRSLRDELLRLHGGGVATAELIPGLTSAASLVLEVEQVQEQEAEAEAEEEQEQEQEQGGEEPEQEVEAIQEPARHSWSREDEGTRPWSLDVLGAPPQPDGARSSRGGFGGSTASPFYPWSQFAGVLLGREVAGAAVVAGAPVDERQLLQERRGRSSRTAASQERRLLHGVGAAKLRGRRRRRACRGRGAVHRRAAQRGAPPGFFDADHDEMLKAAELAASGRAVDLETVAQDAGAAEQESCRAAAPSFVEALVTEQLRSHREAPGANHLGAPGARFRGGTRPGGHCPRRAPHRSTAPTARRAVRSSRPYTDGEVLDSAQLRTGIVVRARQRRSASSRCGCCRPSRVLPPRAQQLLFRRLQAQRGAAPDPRAFFTGEVRAAAASARHRRCRRRRGLRWPNFLVRDCVFCRRTAPATASGSRCGWRCTFSPSSAPRSSASDVPSGFVWLGVRSVGRPRPRGDQFCATPTATHFSHADDFVQLFSDVLVHITAVGARVRGQVRSSSRLLLIPELAHSRPRPRPALRGPPPREPHADALGAGAVETAAALYFRRAQGGDVDRRPRVQPAAPARRAARCHRTTLLDLGHYAVDGKGG